MDALRRKRQRRLRQGYDAQAVAAVSRDVQRRRDPLPPPGVLADLDALGDSVARGMLEVELDPSAASWGFRVARHARGDRDMKPALLALGYRAYDRVTARAAAGTSE